jgi:predicted dinucleotide-binding enzyme
MSHAIIGSGAIGNALAHAFARAKLDVLIANSRGATSLGDLVETLGGSVRAVNLTEALAADIVILAVPFDAAPAVLAKQPEWDDRLVIDATNAIDFPAFRPRDLGGRPSTRILAEAAPTARFVKAFNTIPAAILARNPAEDGGRRVVFLSGDDEGANAQALALIDSLGFAPLLLGPLDQGGRVQEFGGPVVAQNLIRKA